MSNDSRFREQVEGILRTHKIDVAHRHVSTMFGLDGQPLQFHFLLKNVAGHAALPMHCFWQSSSGSTDDKVYKYVALDLLRKLHSPVACVLCGSETKKIRSILNHLGHQHFVMDMNELTEWLIKQESVSSRLF